MFSLLRKRWTLLIGYLISSLMLIGFTFNGKVQAQPGQTLQFDASNNDGVEISDDNSLDITGSITIETWVKLAVSQNSNTVNPHIIRKGDVGSQGNYFLIAEGGTGKVWLRVNDGTNKYNLKGTTDLRDNKWHHIAGVYDPSSGDQFVYVDGMKENSKNIGDVTPLQTNTVSLGLMFRPNKNDEYVNGELDEVRIWSEARTQTQIQKFMHQEVKDVSGKNNLQAYYRFDNGSGNTLSDETANNNDGTLKNSPTWVSSNAVLENLSELGEQSSGSGAYNSELAAAWESKTSSTSDGLEAVENSSNTFSTSENVIFGSNGNTGQVNGKPTGVDTQLSREWLFDINASNNTKTVNLVFTTSDAGASGLPSGIDANDFVLIENSDPTGSSYSKLVTGASSVNDNNNTVAFDGVTLTRDNSYTLGTNDNANSPLPVELTYFQAEKAGSQVVLDWATASETNNRHFVVQRQTEGDWKNIGQVQGHGTSTETHEYQFRDQHPVVGQTNYYRLKQIDFDGRYEYHDIRAVELKTRDEIELKVLENPVGGELRLRLRTGLSQPFHYQVVNPSGIVVKQGSWPLGAGQHSLSIPMNTYPKGIYFLRIQNGDEQWFRKVVK